MADTDPISYPGISCRKDVVILQVLAIELVILAIDFVPLANEFVLKIRCFGF